MKDANVLCGKESKIYALAEKYCTKSKDCAAPEIEIK
jgi:hypothetical protein